MLAVDPSSPFTGGAILGDRVRMQDHATDPGVFIRSMATRGHLGGLALATPEAIRLLDALGHRWILVETVGVGQVEVEVAGKADTTVVVVNPGWGDSVQANKAGLMEVADVFVINKADRPGVAETRRDLEQMLELSAETARRPDDGWRVPIVADRGARPATASTELWDAVLAHREHADASGVLERRRRLPPRRGAARDRRPPPRAAGPRALHRRPLGRADGPTSVAGDVDPWSAADEMLDRVLTTAGPAIAGRSRRASRYTQLVDDPLGLAQVAPPDVDDLPAELAQHAAFRRASRCWAVGVACHCQLLALDADLAQRDRRGRARRAGCRAVAHRVPVDRGGCRPRRAPGRRRAGTSSGAGGCRPARRAASAAPAARSGRGAATPGRRRAARRRTRPAAARCRAPAPSARCQTAGASRASVLAIDSAGIPPTATTWSRIGPRVRWTTVPGAGMRVGALAADDVDGRRSARSRRDRAGGRRRRGRPRSRRGTARPPSPGPRTSPARRRRRARRGPATGAIPPSASGPRRAGDARARGPDSWWRRRAAVASAQTVLACPPWARRRGNRKRRFSDDAGNEAAHGCRAPRRRARRAPPRRLRGRPGRSVRSPCGRRA